MFTDSCGKGIQCLLDLYWHRKSTFRSREALQGLETKLTVSSPLFTSLPGSVGSLPQTVQPWFSRSVTKPLICAAVLVPGEPTFCKKAQILPTQAMCTPLLKMLPSGMACTLVLISDRVWPLWKPQLLLPLQFIPKALVFPAALSSKTHSRRATALRSMVAI